MVRCRATCVARGQVRYDAADLAKALRRARLIVVTPPANPTRGVFSPESLEQIAWWADRRDALILSDETFRAYCYEGTAAGMGSLTKARRRTVTIGSVSKSHALAAARVGWLAG